MVRETRKILHDDDIRCTVTCVRVPVYVGHAVSRQRALPPADDARPRRSSCCATRPACGSSTTATATRPRSRPPASTRCSSAGVREDPSEPGSLNLWVTGDNLRKGAALNGCRWPRSCSPADRREIHPIGVNHARGSRARMRRDHHCARGRHTEAPARPPAVPDVATDPLRGADRLQLRADPRLGARPVGAQRDPEHRRLRPHRRPARREPGRHRRSLGAPHEHAVRERRRRGAGEGEPAAEDLVPRRAARGRLEDVHAGRDAAVLPVRAVPGAVERSPTASAHDAGRRRRSPVAAR